MERRLAAILIADVVGYSRYMGEDEAGAFNALKALRKEVFAPKVAEHHGRIVKLMGDGALVEFASVVDAVNCAVAGRAHLLGRALYVARRYAEAIEAFKQVRVPRYGHQAEIAGCHAQLGSDEKAREHAGEVLRLKPDFSIADHMGGLPFTESRDREHYRDGLRKAGLPE